MPGLPSGMVTFLFTDIEGSTPLWEHEPDRMRLALARHHAILRVAIAAEAGHTYKTIGDAFQAAFALPIQALAAALAAQRALAAQAWETSEPLRVRMGVHIGPALAEGNDYSTTHTLNRVARIMAAGHGGQILLSSEVADLVRRELPATVTLREMGAHRMKGLAHLEHLFQLVALDLPATFPPLKTLDQHPTNLPLQPTGLIGREKEIASVCALLRRADIRLVTLTGPGGTGKTRLALQSAAELLDEFGDGVWFVNLAPLSDPALVIPTIAQTLGVTESGNRPLLERLTDQLRQQQVLLLLDNFEQVLAAAPQLAELLASCPKLKLLVTSREVLHLYGEHEFGVPPLELPDRHRLPPLDRLTQYEAVRLFVERAQAAKADFAVTNASASAVAEICHRLDGLPLAIELAAARIKLFSPQALLSRLEQRLNLLTGGGRDRPARQQTIRGAIDWSYNLLDVAEKKLFGRLGVFVGGCTLEAAEAVCNADGALPIHVIDGIASLLDKSLLRLEAGADGEPRVLMLETVREYALERLEESGDADVVRRQHLDYYLTLVETGRYTQGWMSRVGVEHDNLRAALTHAHAQGALVSAGRICQSLEWFWFARGHISEGRGWLERVLIAIVPTMQTTEMLAVIGRMAGYFAYFQGDYPHAMALFEASLARYRDCTDQAGVADLLVNQGMVAEAQGDDTRALECFEASLALRQPLHDRHKVADSLYHLGRLALFQGDPVGAQGLLEQSLALFRQVGSNDGGMVPIVLGFLGYARLALSVGQQVAPCFQEALTLLLEHGNNFMVPYNLIGLAGALAMQGYPTRAATLIGNAETLCVTTGLHPTPGEQAIWDAIVTSVRGQVDETTFAAAWAEGRTMSLDQVVAEALNVAA